MPINRSTGPMGPGQEPPGRTNQQWYDPNLLAEKAAEPDVIQCQCGCTYFEQILVQQFPKLHNVILGQQVPSAGDMGFYVFRCVKCHELYEPQVQIAARDLARKQYEKFLDNMEAPVQLPAPKPERV